MAALGAAFAIFTSKARAESEVIMHQDPRVSAFLDMIGVLETGAENSYDIFYGGSRFTDFTDHPVITGEKAGIPLSPTTCRAAGYAGGKCVSTAAGKYQINVPTLRDLRASHPGVAPDFAPASQDALALALLQKIGALDALLSDDFDGALRLASKRWASLPYSTAQQNPKSRAYALAQYLNHLTA